MASRISGKPDQPKLDPVPERRPGISLRAIIIGIIATAVIDLWLHYTELVLGAHRGHTALANTSIPIGAFNVLFLLVMFNLILRRLAPSLRFSQAELLTIYVMTAVSTVLSSSGGVHFLIPTITAAHYFATTDNHWAGLFHQYIPHWIAQTDPVALKAFYEGNATVEIRRWAVQVAVWSGFLFVFATSTLCMSLILRKQWIEREHLPFPTVALPIEMAKEDTNLFHDSLFWLGAGIAFGIVWLNTLSANYPSIPKIYLRPTDVGALLVTPPWNAIGDFKLAFFPFAIGIGYLLSADVVFSVWFFYLFSKLQLVWSAAIGWNTGAGAGQSSFPYLTFQGAGAFLGLSLASIYISRKHLADVFKAAFSLRESSDPDAREYKFAVFGLIASIAVMILFAVEAGANKPVATVFVLLVLFYLIAATRLRAETGNAWPVGPEVDAFRLLMTVAGTKAYSPADLTSLTYMRAATAGQDFRGTCMPHEMDGLKVADAAGIKPKKLAQAMMLAVAIGAVVSILIALFVWTKYGALAKTNTWRSMQGKQTFDQLQTWLKNPTRPDTGGMLGIGMGFGFTLLLAYLRMSYNWWPFHPVGYCMSNTFTSGNLWMPCFIAWLCKIVITRAGGMKLYRRALPLFFGFIVGDFLGGGTTTILGCLTQMDVYPMNW
jgi:hypothetical protein